MPTSPRRTEYLLDRYGGQTEEGLAVERCQQSTKPGLSSKSRRVPQHAYVKLTSKEIHGTGNSQNTPIWSPQQPLLLQRHCHSLLTDRGISNNIFSFRSSPVISYRASHCPLLVKGRRFTGTFLWLLDSPRRKRRA